MVDAKTISAYAGLITSITAMIVAISALNKKPQESTAHDMYKTLVLAIERLSDESEQNRADLVRLRKYIHESNESFSKDLNPPAPPVISPPLPIVQIVPPSNPVAFNDIDNSDCDGIEDGNNSTVNSISSAAPPISYSVDLSVDAGVPNMVYVDPLPSRNPPVQLNREWISK